MDRSKEAKEERAKEDRAKEIRSKEAKDELRALEEHRLKVRMGFLVQTK